MISKSNLMIINSILGDYKRRMYHKQEFDPKKNCVLDAKTLENLQYLIINELETTYKDS